MPVRIRGLLLFLGGAGVFAQFAYWIANPDAYPFDYYPAGPGGAVLVGAPGAAAIIGLIELLSGKPFYKVEEAWANLSGVQRFFGGTLIVIVGGAIVFAALGMALL